MLKRALLIGLLGVVVQGVLAAPARACSVEEPQPYALDPAEMAVDNEPPAAIGAVEVSIRRGHVHGGCSGDSCDDLGSITLAFAAPADDRTPPEAIGYRARLVEGALPAGHRATLLDNAVEADVYPPTEPVVARLYISWTDDRDNTQEPVRLALELIPLDKAGNEGPPTLVTVVDPLHVGGCSLADQRRWAGVDFVVLVIVGVAFARGRRLGRA